MSVKRSMMVKSNICPLCYEPNLCLSVSNNGSDRENCWCQSADVIIPKALLALIPANNKGISCICEACVKEFHIESSGQNR